MNGQGREFRFFQDQAGFLRYAVGTWWGSGLHNDPLALNSVWRACLQSSDHGLHLELLAGPSERPRPWQKRYRNTQSLYRMASLVSSPDVLVPSAGPGIRSQVEPDLVRMEEDGLSIEIMALEKNRLEIIVRKETIRFAGTLLRPAWFRPFYQAIWLLRRFSARRSSRRRNT